MNELKIAMALISTATLLGYTSATQFRIQPSIAILTLSLLIVITANIIEPITGHLAAYDQIAYIIQNAHFQDLLMDIMLPILLFAGAMSMNAAYFKKHQWTILILAIVSTIASTFLIGFGFYALMQYLGTPMELIYCLLFGALISPTDPVAVVGMVKQSNLAPDIEAKVAGESLFNDGVGIVLFITLYEAAFHHPGIMPASDIIIHFFYEAIGGGIIGIVSGYLCRWLLSKEASHTHNHILISIFVVTGIYTATNYIGMSGPLAMVVCGLMMAEYTSTSEQDYKPLKYFWETLEEILNMVLYLLIGFEAFLLPFTHIALMVALASVSLTLFSRILTVSIPLFFLSHIRRFEPKTKRILIWGGLRGGLAVALTLSLPDIPEKNTILIATYAVVCFTTIVQGGTISALMKKS